MAWAISFALTRKAAFYKAINSPRVPSALLKLSPITIVIDITCRYVIRYSSCYSKLFKDIAKEINGFFEHLDKGIDFGGCIVKIQASAGS